MTLLKIKNKFQSIPLIQGGMGVGISLERLAGAVASCGGVGTISTADCGYREADFSSRPEEANLRALRDEIKIANQISGGRGLIAVNAMVATRQYAAAVETAVRAGIDAVISGAGLPLELPKYVPEGSALIAPIVSGARSAALIARAWFKKFRRFPDFVVVEGPNAGGHLGFKEEELLSGHCKDIYELLPEVARELVPYEQSAGKAIPLFAAGGIWDSDDIQRAMSCGADGVQMATRFIATEECDASRQYKEILLNAASEEIQIIQSPVGMPGRALRTPFIRRLSKGGKIPPERCSRCIKSCNPASVPYCITHALIEAVRGNLEEGLFFCGSRVGKMKEITTVSQLIRTLFA